MAGDPAAGLSGKIAGDALDRLARHRLPGGGGFDQLAGKPERVADRPVGLQQGQMPGELGALMRRQSPRQRPACGMSVDRDRKAERLPQVRGWRPIA
jgi:hypothetical protein